VVPLSLEPLEGEISPHFGAESLIGKSLLSGASRRNWQRDGSRCPICGAIRRWWRARRRLRASFAWLRAFALGAEFEAGRGHGSAKRVGLQLSHVRGMGQRGDRPGYFFRQ